MNDLMNGFIVKGRNAVVGGRKTVRQMREAELELGNLALKVEIRYGRGALKRFAEEIDMDSDTLRKYKILVICFGRPTCVSDRALQFLRACYC